MLDFRHETFLALCKTKNYTKAADILNITQPAVSQHIKFLEEYYKTKLFSYKGKVLSLTKQGKLLQEFAVTMSADSEKLRNKLAIQSIDKYNLTFGATLTIGEYVMPPIIAQMLKGNPHLHVTMLVDNTKVLLEKLKNGKIDFAFIEGFFDKSEYGSAVFSHEQFVPICSKDSQLACEKNKNINFAQTLKQRLILREKGSGTRDVLEQLLSEHNLTISSFEQICEIGNMSAIKQLVRDNFGIAFLYRAAVEKELEDGELVELDIDGFYAVREFNFVYLKDSLHQNEYLKRLDFFINSRKLDKRKN